MNVQRSIGTDSLYERDFHAWLDTQACLIRSGQPGALDLPNLLEEIEAMGAAQVSELESRIALVIEHLIKHQYGLNRDPALGWQRTLLEQRSRIARLVRKNPSIRRYLDEAISGEYSHARKLALLGFKQYEPLRLDDYTTIIPDTCPYTVEQILDEDWLPEPSI